VDSGTEAGLWQSVEDKRGKAGKEENKWERGKREGKRGKEGGEKENERRKKEN